MVTFSLCSCKFLLHRLLIVQIDLLISVGNPSSITTCTQIFYSKLSNSLLPSVCIPAHQDSCSLHITSFPDFPHMLGEPENEACLQTHASCYLFPIKVSTIQTSLNSQALPTCMESLRMKLVYKLMPAATFFIKVSSICTN